MKKNNKGFSLVELIVVIVILAIIIGITIVPVMVSDIVFSTNIVMWILIHTC